MFIAKQTRIAVASLLAAVAMPDVVAASDFDGSKNLVCANVDVVACVEGNQGPICQQGHSRRFELADFLRIDFQKKEISATGNDVVAVSPIRNLEKTKTQLVMQGVENDMGWTTTLDLSDGTFTLSLSGREVSFFIFGACTAL